MTAMEDRRRTVDGIDEAHKAGEQPMRLTGITARTLQRWRQHGDVHDDRRVRQLPAHALSEAELLRVVNAPHFADLPPAEIVPRLADEGVYLASESTFHRVLRAQGQITRRGCAKAPAAVRRPTTHTARGPGEVRCWDVTWLPARVTGRWLCLYLILDLYSRKIIGHVTLKPERDTLAAICGSSDRGTESKRLAV